ncbi:MAG: Aromatic amino acid permease [Candidatus Wolfebacteria bacterium GW2011_GWC2_39_22]|uniref:Aromatic amino acid permease n=2 Tax=Candidatus Wolfeibacteriota TaxID=1752735 RepID=A0A0G1H787_9BACT|nr:MAG: Aromatic amino acid permease [Candidatus Wolfebacteria bacterium GW2011_GWC2_39_22]KKT43241.1 MAG: Aromatic amino acid permease [Candidatus Wolfebacteria bacterium GW2011_GWE2_44_13]
MITFLKNLILPISFLVSNIIGAGMFALPFVFQQSGLVVGIFYLVFFGVLAAIIHLLYADIVLRTNETRLQFPGYIKKYLGKNAGFFSSILVCITLLFTLTAYLVLSSSFLHIIIPALSPLVAMFLFWALATITIFISIKHTAIFDTITAAITIIAIGTIFAYWGIAFPFEASLFPIVNFEHAFLPFGPVLFSLIGFSAIPALVAYTRKESVSFVHMKRAIIWGSLLPAFFYFLYTVSIWGLSSSVSPDSLSGLVDTVPFSILITLSILGFVSLWDSYSAVGRDINKLLEYEWLVTPANALVIVASTPLILYFLGFQNFITLVSAIGGILFSIWGILIILAWKKAIRVHLPSVKFSTFYVSGHTYSIVAAIPSFIINLLLVVFAGGIIYEAIQLIGLLIY